TEFDALASSAAPVYTAGELLTDVRRGVWSELRDGRVEIDAFRRNLQRSWLDEVDRKLNPLRGPESGPPVPSTAAPAPGDVPALLRGELRQLDTELRTALPRAADRTTRLHIEDARVRIGRILEPVR